MTTGVPFLNVYLESLIDPAANTNIVSTQSKDEQSPPSASLFYDGTSFSRQIAASTQCDNNMNSRFVQIPPKIWCNILQHLPLSQLTELNLVCRRLFCIVRFKSCVWLHIRKLIYPTLPDLIPVHDGTTPLEQLIQLEWMAYTQVKRSFGVACDNCYRAGDLNVNKHGSAAVLPVLVNSSQQLYLCLACRQQHYLIYPEPAPILADTEATLTFAFQKYCLPLLFHTQQVNIRESDVVALGRLFHGGDVGIQAERQRLAHIGYEPYSSKKASS